MDTLLNILKLDLSLGHLVLLAQLADLLLALVHLSVCFWWDQGIELLLVLQDLLLVLLYILGTAQVGTEIGLVNIIPILMVVCQAISNEVLASVRHWRLRREVDLASI